MYAALWRALPGNAWLKAVQSLLLLAAVIAVLFLWVFPAVAPLMPYNEVTIQPGSTGTSTPAPTSGGTPAG